MKKVIKCPSCGSTVVLNTRKHRYRPKYCPKCRTVVDNAKPKHRILSVFQRKKKERKQRTRERFINKMLGFKMTMKQIEKRLTNYFVWEDDVKKKT